MSDVEVTQSLARPTAYGIAVRGAGMALALAVTIFLARNLAADDLGVYQGVLSICIILGGLAAATAERPAARRIAVLDRDDPDELSSEIALVHLVVGIAMLAIVLVLVAGSVLPGIPEGARVTLRCAALVAPGLAILSLRQWIALPLQGVSASLGPEQIGLPIAFLGAAGIVAYQSGLRPFQALLIYAVVCWAVWLVSSWRSGLLSLLLDGVRERPSRTSLRLRFSEGRPFVLFTIVGVLAGSVTVPLVAALLDLADAGRLAIAMQLTLLVAVPLQIASLSMMPQAARLHRTNDTAALDRLVRTTSTISLVSGLGLAVLLWVSLGTILSMLGPSYAATRDLIPVLVVGQLINAALGPNGPTLQMIGLERDVAWVETAATVLRLLAVAFAAVSATIVGVAVALAVTSSLRNLALTIILHRRVGILSLPQFPRHRDLRV